MPSIRRILSAPATRLFERAPRPGGGAAGDQLDHQQAVARVAEGAAEGRDGRERVLAREGRAEMHDVEHHQRIVRQSELAAHIRRHRHRRQRMMHDVHRLVRRRRDGVAGKFRRHPDLVNVAEARLPVLRQARQFPGPVADDATRLHACAPERPQRVRQKRPVVMHDQAAAARLQGAPADIVGKFDMAESRAEIERRGRIAGRFKRGVGQPRAFADTACGRKHAGDRYREAAARTGVRQGRDEAADIEQDLPPRRLWQPLPQSSQGAAARRRLRCHQFKR